MFAVDALVVTCDSGDGCSGCIFFGDGDGDGKGVGKENSFKWCLLNFF